MGDTEEFLNRLGMKGEQGQSLSHSWDEVIQPLEVYMVLGDRRQGKTGLGMWLLEEYSRKYDLTPACVGFPLSKRLLLPDYFETPTIDEVVRLERHIILIDEAGLQLPIEDTKERRKEIVNLLSLVGQRHNIMFLSFHFPRLALARYLPYFSGFLMKRPPYLLEFASKIRGDTLSRMMERAEERFAELPSAEAVKRHTYVVAPAIRWQGLLRNPLPSFWSQEVSEAWAGVDITGQTTLGWDDDWQHFLCFVDGVARLVRQRGELSFAEIDGMTLVARLGRHTGAEVLDHLYTAGLEVDMVKKVVRAR